MNDLFRRILVCVLLALHFGMSPAGHGAPQYPGGVPGGPIVCGKQVICTSTGVSLPPHRAVRSVPGHGVTQYPGGVPGGPLMVCSDGVVRRALQCPR
jgi:hypothetical protein